MSCPVRNLTLTGSAAKVTETWLPELGTRPPDLTRIAARRDGVIVDGYSKRYLPCSEMPIYDEFLEGPLVAFDTGNGIQQRTPAGSLVIAQYLETIQDPRPIRTVP